MRPAENPLARARQAAHDNLRQQAVERVHAALSGLPAGRGSFLSFLQNAMRPGNILPRGAQGALSGGGHPESASSMAIHAATNQMGQQLAGANLSGALNGGGPAPAPSPSPIPSWVLTQMSNEMQGDAGGRPNILAQQGNPGGANAGGLLQLMHPGQGPTNPFRLPTPGIPRLPEHPLGSGIGVMPKFIHLGGGLFLHPETGEVHGMGTPVSSTPNALARPGMAAL